VNQTLLPGIQHRLRLRREGQDEGSRSPVIPLLGRLRGMGADLNVVQG